MQNIRRTYTQYRKYTWVDLNILDIDYYDNQRK